MDNDRITSVELIFLSVVVMVSHIILDIPNVILSSTASAAPLNVIYITGIALLFFIIVTKLFKPFNSRNILDVAEFIGGSFLKRIISIIYTLHLIFISGILILSFADTIKTIYLQDMPASLICLVFVLVAVIANLFGFRSVSKTNVILLPLILFSIILIFITLCSDLVPQRIFPVLGYGVDATFISGFSNVFAYAQLLVLLLISPNLKESKDFKKVGIISILSSGFFLLLTVSCLLLLFPYSTGNEGVLSIYMITRSIQFCKFFQRADALFILIWVLTFFCYLSVILSFLVKLTNRTTITKKSTPSIYIIAVAIFIVTLIPQNIAQIRFAENIIYKYISLIVVFGFSLVILIIGYFKKRKQNGIVEITTNDNTKGVDNKLES